MNKWNKLLACLAVLVVIGGCGGSDDDEPEQREGGQCQPCRGTSTSSNRCDSGLTCSTFQGNNGKRYDLCASAQTTQCSVQQ